MRIYIAYSEEGFFEDLKRVIEVLNLGSICGDSAGEPVQVREIMEARPDVVITDLKLPGMDGIGLTNMALLGMHDAANETYARYCNNFYPIADLRLEIEYLEGERPDGGKISIKKFLNAMLSEFQVEEADKMFARAI